MGKYQRSTVTDFGECSGKYRPTIYCNSIAPETGGISLQGIDIISAVIGQ
jgi:hypothetical protein